MAKAIRDVINADVTRLEMDHERSKAPKNKKMTVLENHGYRIGRIIGSGSFATVKIAYSEEHKCDVAIKIVDKYKYKIGNMEKFLMREIEVVKGLEHINLICYHQAIETTHRIYIIMEYAENGSLFDFLETDKEINEGRARKWFKELVDAVEYCHLNGIVHRDLKCENLLLDANYNIKLSDFGFARDNMIKKNGKIKTSSTFCGSYAYASPEILKGIPYQATASDIWSIGVILYAIIYSSLPFGDPDRVKMIKKVQTEMTFPENDKVSKTCKQMIAKLLAPLKVRLTISEIKEEPWYNE